MIGAGMGDPLRLRRSQGQGEMKRRALALAALGPDPSAMQLDELLADGQAEPGAVGLLGERIVQTLERLEQALEVAGRDADTGVGDGYVQHIRLVPDLDEHPATV